MRTDDLPRLVDYYERVLSLVPTEVSGEAAYLATGADHHAIALERGPQHSFLRLGLQIHGSLDDAAARLAATGIRHDRVADFEPGVAEAIFLAEPLTGKPIHLYERQGASGLVAGSLIRPTKLGHVASYVPDVLEVQKFYIDVLGFRWSDMIGDFFTFLRCGPDHHAVNLMASSTRSGAFHVAFETRDVVHLKHALDHLGAAGYRLEWGPGRHGVGHNVFSYHRNPDGELTELFCEIDQIFDETTGHFEPRPWHEELPQAPKVWPADPSASNIWGPINFETIAH
jgi:catechol 2,3-dioxygenase-like lactoylglutathione lyase family enzyme